ncbi:MAG TPA: O-antigen ligase family protein [Gaiellaceae bacterium]|nr:O-antigen ligase family protein [Gaiellaceae bacterium]
MIRPRAADVLPLVAAAALPLIFLHARYQAETSVGPVGVYGSDVAIAAVVAAAFLAGVKLGWEPLRRGRTLWIVAAALLLLFVIACLWRPLESPTKHLVTAAKMIEYALLAPAAVLLFRRRIDLDRFLAVFVAWALAAGVWGLLQFLGVVNEFEGRRTGQREVSFLGHQDLGGFTGAALAVGFAAIVLGERRRLAALAVVGGALGVMIDASVFAFLGTVLAAIAISLIGRRAGTLTSRRLAALAAILFVVGSGVYVLRGSDVSNYLSFLGLSKAAQTDTGVQTGSQRTMLLWIGWRMWVDHPVLGVGFERSSTDFQPYLAAAREKFPNQPAESYPSKQNPWGVQNFWVQLLADTGIVGFLLGLATFGTGLVTALRAVPRRAFVAAVSVGFILVAAGTWNAIGIIAGIPLDAVTWLGLGLGIVAWEISE